MALNLNRLWSAGRRVARLVRDVRRAPSPSPRPSVKRHRGPGGAAGAGPRGQVLDYPGDFHGRARVEYTPVPGPVAGPGEVVWTWVPFEELDGRGKDRPVLVVGRDGEYLLAVQLTTRDRNNGARRDEDYIDIGTGPWDERGRPSEAKLDRILQVSPRDIRREGGVLGRRVFERVARGLHDRNGWS
jgi:PemK-like, MazF-like toxin of type II toxin-antitoxin system